MGKSKRCQVCRAAIATGDLCAKHEAATKRIYGDAAAVATQETDMGQTRVTSRGRKVSVEAVKPDDSNEPFGGYTEDDESQIVAVDADADDAPDSSETEPEETDDEHDNGTPNDSDAPPSDVADEPDSAVQAKRRTSTKLAAKRLARAVAQLEFIDWEAIGVEGVRGGIAILRNSLIKVESLKSNGGGGKRKLSDGMKVSVKQAITRYNDILDADERKGLTVVRIRKGSAVCQTRGKLTIVLPIAALEVQS